VAQQAIERPSEFRILRLYGWRIAGTLGRTVAQSIYRDEEDALIHSGSAQTNG